MDITKLKKGSGIGKSGNQQDTIIKALIDHGFMDEAYEHAKPMFERVVKNNGFFEWYTVDNKPKGSATFKGSAGVLYDAILTFEKYSDQPNNYLIK